MNLSKQNQQRKAGIMEVYEIPNTFTNDLTLDEQIALGINDWQAECKNGHVYFGKTKAEAVENANKGGN
jgi:tryptophanyl-tRNA synthetase